MSETWARISEFPSYSVSDYGRVMNQDTGRLLRESKTPRGLVKVGLVRGGKQYTRAVGLLVAEMFVDGRTEECDTLIHLDGDPEHNHAFNLAWRPRWFAWKYHRQFDVITIDHSRGPIVNINTREKYVDMFDAAISNGLLVDDIRRSINARKEVFPTWQTFDFAK